jgi:uncharacterized protein YhfF
MDMHPADVDAVAAMWAAYRTATGTDAELLGSFAFGDSGALADELAELVRTGPKRATATLLADFERDGEALPREGEHWVVLDGTGRPRCVIRTVRVDVKPFANIDAADAWDEGEGDRSLAEWVAGHRRFFGRRCEQLGLELSDDLEVVFERFEMVWPRAEDADAAR